MGVDECVLRYGQTGHNCIVTLLVRIVKLEGLRYLETIGLLTSQVMPTKTQPASPSHTSFSLRGGKLGNSVLDS